MAQILLSPNTKGQYSFQVCSFWNAWIISTSPTGFITYRTLQITFKNTFKITSFKNKTSDLKIWGKCCFSALRVDKYSKYILNHDYKFEGEEFYSKNTNRTQIRKVYKSLTFSKVGIDLWIY